MKRIAIVIAAIVGASSTTQAAGFVLNDHGAKATGRADAVSATVNNGSAIFYNPAGLVMAEGLVNIYLGASLILPAASLDDDESGKTFDAELDPTVVPTLYASGAITDTISWGLGFFAPFGTSLGWPEGAPGNDEITFQELRTFFISPVLSFNLERWVRGLSIGGGVDFVPASVELERDVVFGSDTGTSHLGGTGLGIGGRIGVMYAPPALRQLSVGIAYRSRVKIDFEGEADFDIEPPFRDLLPPDGDISTSITLPDSILAGIAYRPIPQLELEFDINWMNWSTFDQLDIVLPGGTVLESVRGYQATVALRFGAEYAFTDIGLDIRGGYAYDPTPIPDELLTINLPDIDRHVVSVGASYQLPRRMFIDLGILWVLPGDNTTSAAPETPPIKGTYNVEALVTALSFGARFGDAPTKPRPQVAKSKAGQKKTTKVASGR